MALPRLMPRMAARINAGSVVIPARTREPQKSRMADRRVGQPGEHREEQQGDEQFAAERGDDDADQFARGEGARDLVYEGERDEDQRRIPSAIRPNCLSGESVSL